MSESFKICPICGASNHPNAPICSTCGTALNDVSATSAKQLPQSSMQAHYDFRHGETDLYEQSLNRVGQAYLAGIVSLLVLLMIVGLGLTFGRSLFEDNPTTSNAMIETNTPLPTINLPTVTQGPPTSTPSNTPTVNPTPTITPTREPCMPVVQSGDGLFSVLPRCGYTFSENQDIIDIVLELNNMNSATDLREGQVLEVPWPTETIDPNLVPTATPEGEDSGESNTEDGETVANVSAFDEDFDPLFVPTATLQPGIMLHTVQPNENIIVIGLQYGANVEILSQLNPEIAFSQCDFGLDFGGERCSVFLAEGQRIRVPAPTGVPTLSPTPNGSETPTPTATPTFNAPNAISPSNRAVFTRDQLVTLRWIGSGRLGNEQSYRLRVEDLTAGIVFTADTLDSSFVLPAEWQGSDELRHEYEWTVSVIDNDNPDDPYFVTESLTFIWEGRG